MEHTERSGWGAFGWFRPSLRRAKAGSATVFLMAPIRDATARARALRAVRNAFASLCLLVTTAACAASDSYMGIALTPGATAPEVQALAVRARNGDKQAQLALGVRFEEGRGGVIVDREKAKQLYGLAAEDFSDISSLSYRKNQSGDSDIDHNKGHHILTEAKVRLALLNSADKPTIDPNLKWPNAEDIDNMRLVNPFVFIKYCQLVVDKPRASPCADVDDVLLLDKLLKLEEYYFYCENKLALDITSRSRNRKIYACAFSKDHPLNTYIAANNEHIVWMLWYYSRKYRDNVYDSLERERFKKYTSDVAKFETQFNKSYLSDFVVYMASYSEPRDAVAIDRAQRWAKDWRSNCRILLKSGMLDESDNVFEKFACEYYYPTDKK